jgi:hypothetical protein
MKKEEIIEHIDSNKENLPLLFTDLVFKNKNIQKNNPKITSSIKFKDSSYLVYKFYKPISRF